MSSRFRTYTCFFAVFQLRSRTGRYRRQGPRRGGISVFEDDAVGRQGVDPGRERAFIPIGSHVIRPERVDGDEDDVRSFFPRDVQDGLDPVGKDASGSGRDEPQPGFARPGRKRDAFPDLVDRPGRPGLGLFEVSFVQDRLAAGVFEDNLELDFAAWGSGGGEPGGRMDVMDDPDPEIQDALWACPRS